ncbi:MAG: hypothetical protein ACYCTG_00720 [Ferrimicrobium sp.]
MSRFDEITARIEALGALVPGGLYEGIGHDKQYHSYLDGPTYRELLDHAVDDLIWAVNELGKFYARSDILESRPDGAQINHGVRTDRVAYHKVAKR